MFDWIFPVASLGALLVSARALQESRRLNRAVTRNLGKVIALSERVDNQIHQVGKMFADMVKLDDEIEKTLFGAIEPLADEPLSGCKPVVLPIRPYGSGDSHLRN